MQTTHPTPPLPSSWVVILSTLVSEPQAVYLSLLGSISGHEQSPDSSTALLQFNPGTMTLISYIYYLRLTVCVSACTNECVCVCVAI